MGANYSSLSNKILNEVIVDLSTKVVNTSTSKQDTSLTSSQVINAVFTRATIKCPDIRITQNIDARNEVFRSREIVEQAVIQNTNENVIKEAIQNAIDQSNEQLNLLQVNVSEVQNIIENTVFSDLSTDIRSTMLDVFTSPTALDQNLDLNFTDAEIICGSNGNFTIEQNINVEQIVENIISEDRFVEAKNKVINNLETDIENTITQKNVGINLLFLLFLLLIPIILVIVFIVGGSSMLKYVLLLFVYVLLSVIITILYILWVIFVIPVYLINKCLIQKDKICHNEVKYIFTYPYNAISWMKKTPNNWGGYLKKT